MYTTFILGTTVLNIYNIMFVVVRESVRGGRELHKR